MKGRKRFRRRRANRGTPSIRPKLTRIFGGAWAWPTDNTVALLREFYREESITADGIRAAAKHWLGVDFEDSR